MNYYRRYLGDYMGKTMHLSMMEHGAYNLLLDAYYATERPLPTEYESLYRICRAMSKAEQEAVRKVADAYFPTYDDGLRHNPRADKEVQTAQATIEKQRESGVKLAVNRIYKDRSTVRSTGKSTSRSTTRSSGGETGQPSTTNLQPSTVKPPTANHHPPTKTISPGAAKPAPPARGNGKPPTVETWSHYAEAYERRYAVEPVRNAKVNGQLSQLVQRLGSDEAPLVAAFYVTHNKSLYVGAKHCVDLLLRDCEGLRTEWATGRTVTDTEARQADRKQSNLSVAEKLIAEARNAGK